MTFQYYYTFVLRNLCTSNHMFGRAILDKLRERIFENFEIALVKRD